MKRTFSRQLLLTLGLILLTILVLSLSFQVLYYSYTISMIHEDLSSTAEAAADMAQACNVDTLAEQTLVLRMQLSFISRATEESVVVLDRSGTVTSCSCGLQSCNHLGYQFDTTQLNPQEGENESFSAKLVTDLYDQKRYAVAMPVYTYGTTQRSGYVIASADAQLARTVMTSTLRLNLLTVLTVLPLAVAAVYLVVSKQTKPMKQLADAARRLGRGQTSVRVPTGGFNTAEMDELAVAFNNMSQALEKSETKRQEFVANVSHELKTPMTTISGYLDGILDGTIPPEQQQKYMQIVSSEVKRLSRLVRNMLEISRLQDKGIPEEKKCDFDLCETVGQVLISFEKKINDKHIDVQTQLPDEPAMGFADPDSITQVVYNLMDNAVKFCPEGGTLGVGISQTRNNKYLVSVSNTGPTISPEELPLVFDRFHKTDKSRSVDRDGVGLGLYIVKTIICSHEEDIFVSSKDGKTEFSFTIRKA